MMFQKYKKSFLVGAGFFALILALWIFWNTKPEQASARKRSATAPTIVQEETPTSLNCPTVYPGSFWNKRVSDLGLGVNQHNTEYIQELLAPERPLGSATNAYTYPLYRTTSKVPKVTVSVAAWFSNVTEPGKLTLSKGASFSVNIPSNALPSPGSDGHLVVLDSFTGDEWGFWKAAKQSDGSWTAESGYHYNINWNSEVPTGFGARGAGIPYLAGLIRKCEVDQGAIKHAIAFGYTFPCGPRATGSCRNNSPEYVYPAIKSDGKADEAWAMPEGARLYISPPASSSEKSAWCGSDKICLMMLKALEDYGMIVVDNAGSSKLYAESSLTANWGSALTQYTPSKIPLSRFKVLEFAGN